MSPRYNVADAHCTHDEARVMTLTLPLPLARVLTRPIAMGVGNIVSGCAAAVLQS